VIGPSGFRCNSKRYLERLQRDGSHLGDLGNNSVKRSSFERVAAGDRNHMDGRAVVPGSYMASFLADHSVSDLLKRMNQTISGNAAGRLHAASTEISSSFT